MIINTELIKVRKLDNHGLNYLAIYGTQDNPYSRDYDLLEGVEIGQMTVTLAAASERLKELSEQMAEMATALKSANDQSSATAATKRPD